MYKLHRWAQTPPENPDPAAVVLGILPVLTCVKRVSYATSKRLQDMPYLQVHRSLAILVSHLEWTIIQLQRISFHPQGFLTVTWLTIFKTNNTRLFPIKFIHFLGNPCRSERSNTCLNGFWKTAGCDSMCNCFVGAFWKTIEMDGVSGMPRTASRRFCNQNWASYQSLQRWMLKSCCHWTTLDDHRYPVIHWKGLKRTGSDWLSLFEICLLG